MDSLRIHLPGAFATELLAYTDRFLKPEAPRFWHVSTVEKGKRDRDLSAPLFRSVRREPSEVGVLSHDNDEAA